jgi:predicted transcriptional regulator
MPVLSCYVDDDTMARLERVSRETGRAVEELAESAISEAAMLATRMPDPMPVVRS